MSFRSRTVCKEKKSLNGGAEYLSGLTKTDRLKPIVTVVLYYGDQIWDGGTDLHGLLDMGVFMKESAKEYIRTHKDYFEKVDKDTFEAIKVMMGASGILNAAEYEGGRISMCKALEDLYQEGKDEGKVESIYTENVK